MLLYCDVRRRQDFAGWRLAVVRIEHLDSTSLRRNDSHAIEVGDKARLKQWRLFYCHMLQ